MIVLLKGDKLYRKWWHGEAMKCSTCGRSVLLEAGDEGRDEWIHSGPNNVKIHCVTCGDWMELSREEVK